MRETSVTPIAVVGMACRLPGGIDSPHKLWEALLEATTSSPRFRRTMGCRRVLRPRTRGARPLGVALGRFHRRRHGLRPRLLRYQRARGHRDRPAAPHAAGDLLGGRRARRYDAAPGCRARHRRLHRHVARRLRDGHRDAGAFDEAYGFTGTPFSMASGRISYMLWAFTGRLTMDTACSSSLVAVHMACRSLHDGESDMALAGGVMLMLDQRMYASASGQGMLSPTGHCHAFDVAADGFVRSEGCAVVLLKRLPDAERDGDRILAVMRGTASNQDGRTENILTPSTQAQISVFQAALAVAGVDPATVGMVEAHGTGTPVGDTNEFNSISSVYGAAGPCALTSVKTNFGHAESAAGVLGLMKAVLAVHHGVVPKNLHFNRLPDNLATIDTGLFVPEEATVAGRRRQESAACGGVLVRHVGHQRARRSRAGARGRRPGRPRRLPPQACWSSRCPPPRPTNCAAPLIGWPTGSSPRREPRAARPGLHAGPSPRAPPGPHRGDRQDRAELIERCARSPREKTPISPRSDTTTADRSGSSPGRARSGRRWVSACWPPSRCSLPRSPRSSR